MLIVLILWSGIYLIWNGAYRGKPYDFRQLLDYPVKMHLWYLYVLVGIYLILPFLQSMFSRLPQSLYPYFFALWVGFLCINDLLFLNHIEVRYPVPMVGDACYLGYFVMGYIVKESLARLHLKTKGFVLLSALCLSVAIGETLFTTCNHGRHIEHFFEYRNVWIALGAILIFAAGLKNSSRQYSHKAKRVIDFISRHSFTLYLCHVLFLDVAKQELQLREISAFIGIPVFSLAVFGIALFASAAGDGMWDFVKGRLHGRSVESKKEKLQEAE